MILFSILILLPSIFAPINSKDTIEDIIKTEALIFSEASFVADPVAVQSIDHSNKLTEYKTPTGDLLFQRQEDDGKEDVVVLNSEQDRLTVKHLKRAFVVFRRQTGKQYYSELVLVRDATAEDTETIEYNGGKRVTEWTYFTNHLANENSHEHLLVLSCASSIVAPCLFSDSAIPSDAVKHPHFKTKKLDSSKVIDDLKFTLEDEQNADLFADLELSKNRQGGRLVAELMGTAVGGVGGGIINTVTGTVSGLINFVTTGLTSVVGGFVGAVGRRKKREEASDHAEDHPGWKTQYITPVKGYYKEDAEIFYGLGNCPYKKILKADLHKTSNNPDEILDFYLKVLRVDCNTVIKPLIQGLLKDGIVTLSSIKIYSLNLQHPAWKTKKLPLKGLINLPTAVELAAFSAVYNENAVPLKLGMDISVSVEFIVRFAVKYLTLAKEVVKTHILHLKRHLIIEIENIFGKLCQDQQILEGCADCKEDVKQNQNDRITILGLHLFIKRGAIKPDEDILKSFHSFFEANRVNIDQYVNFYS